MTAGGRDLEPDPSQTLNLGATVTGLLSSVEFRQGDLVAGRYRIEQLLGMGGMGVVYRAHDEQLDVDVALKFLRPELATRKDAFERFRQELLLARQVSSPNVVRIHDLTQHGDIWLISMDFVEGHSLEHILDKQGRLSPEAALLHTRQLAAGLGAAHARGVVHRDLKPANVLVRDSDGEAVVTDFGVARAAGATGITLTGMVIGTPEYLSPEQAKAEPLDGRSDLYALGLLLYEMLTGKVPFGGGTAAEMMAQRIVRSPPPPDQIVPEIPRLASAICSRLLEVRPSQRFQSAAELITAIDTGQVPKQPGSSRWWIASAAVALFFSAALIWRPWDTMEVGSGNETSVAMAPAPLAHGLAVLQPRLIGIDDARLASGVQRYLASTLMDAQVADVLDPGRVQRAVTEQGLDLSSDVPSFDALTRILPADRMLVSQVRRGGDGLDLELTLHAVNEQQPEWSYRQHVTSEDNLSESLDELLPGLLASLDVQFDAPKTPGLTALRQIGSNSLQADINRTKTTPTEKGSTAPESPIAYLWQLRELRRSAGDAAALAWGQAHVSALATTPSTTSILAQAYLALLNGDATSSLSRLAELPESVRQSSLARQIEAEAKISEGAYGEAQILLEGLLRQDPRDVETLYLLGKVSLMQGEAKPAVDDYLTRGLVVANRQQDLRAQADITNALGIGYRQLGQLQPSSDSFKAAARLRSELGDARGQAVSLRNQAAVQTIQGRFDDAEATLNQARSILVILEDRGSLADLANDAGLLAEERGDHAKALEAYREALGYRQAQGEPRLLAESLLNVGYGYYHTGAFDNALVYLQQAAAAYSGIDDRAGDIRARQGMALVLVARGEFASAHEEVDQSIADAATLSMDEEQLVGLAQLAEIDRLQGHYTKAIESAQHARALFDARNYQRGVIEMDLLHASVLADVADWSALQSLLQSMDAIRIDNLEQQARVATLRSTTALELGHIDEALEHANDAVRHADTSGMAAQKIAAHLILAEVQQGRGSKMKAESSFKIAEDVAEQFLAAPSMLRLFEARLELDQASSADRTAGLRQLSRIGRYGRAWRIFALLDRTGIDKAAVMSAAKALQAVLEETPEASRPALTTAAEQLGVELNP